MSTRSPIFLLASVLTVSAVQSDAANDTERLYLSGTGPADGVEWDFRISAGRRSAGWTTIEVPSQWEQQGFGTYAYGRQDSRPSEVGEYRYRFDAPPDLAGKRVWLVFEGAMTDTEVRWNGESVGEIHQGGFTRFSYSIDRWLRPGESNLLEVRVAEESANRSVNEAERDADYWVFGGIFRPVYLEILPVDGIRRIAIAADHSGELELQVELLGERGVELMVEIRELNSDRRFDSFRVPVNGERAEAARRVPSIRPWSAEDPQLYRVDLSLLDAHGEVLHRHSEVFGFRSVEIDPDRGILVNGKRVLLKGINRHSFWPDTGRTLSREQNEQDARMIKEMNANAVRSSHYPPDVAFLEACDRIGLYVLDELPGWHDAYDTEVGAKLVEELVVRDRNHPSILFWDNGNEGGWNGSLDRHFTDHDPQQRPVLHPGAIAGGLDTQHYPSFEELQERLQPGLLSRLLFGPAVPVMPTEALHGLYDGGLGAGLDDYWKLLRTSPRGAGLFLWAFLDEGIARTDRDGRLDTFSNFAPDGIVGPYREREASFLAVQEIWSPIALNVKRLAHGSTPILRIENRFFRTNLRDCRLEWAWLGWPSPASPAGPDSTEVLTQGSLVGPDLEPGGITEFELDIEPPRSRVDALRVVALDPQGRRVLERVWPLRGPSDFARRILNGETGDRASPIGRHEDDRIELRSGSHRITLDAAHGTLATIEHDGRRLSLSGGPRVSRPGGLPRVSSVSVSDEPGSTTALFRYDSHFNYVRWRLDDRGWLHLQVQYRSEGAAEVEGIFFDYPKAQIERIDWLAAGPHRVWRNRTAGSRLGFWSGTPNPSPPWRTWDYPVLEGFYASPYWARLTTTEGELTMLFESDDEVFLGLLQPRFPRGDAVDGKPMARFTAPPLPAFDLAILHEIPAIGTKFHRFDELGPMSLRRSSPGPRRAAVAFRFQPSDRLD